MAVTQPRGRSDWSWPGEVGWLETVNPSVFVAISPGIPGVDTAGACHASFQLMDQHIRRRDFKLHHRGDTNTG